MAWEHNAFTTIVNEMRRMLKSSFHILQRIVTVHSKLYGHPLLVLFGFPKNLITPKKKNKKNEQNQKPRKLNVNLLRSKKSFTNGTDRKKKFFIRWIPSLKTLCDGHHQDTEEK